MKTRKIVTMTVTVSADKRLSAATVRRHVKGLLDMNRDAWDEPSLSWGTVIPKSVRPPLR